MPALWKYGLSVGVDMGKWDMKSNSETDGHLHRRATEDAALTGQTIKDPMAEGLWVIPDPTPVEPPAVRLCGAATDEESANIEGIGRPVPRNR